MFSFSGQYEVDREQYHPQVPLNYCSNAGPYIDIGVPKSGLLAAIKGLFFHPKTVRAKVDTGSNTTLLDPRVAEMLNIDLKVYDSSRVEMIKFADGSVYPVIRYEIDLMVAGRKLDEVPVFFPLLPESAYSEYLLRQQNRQSQERAPLCNRMPRRNLLGNKGVLNRLMLCIDSKNIYVFHRRSAALKT